MERILPVGYTTVYDHETGEGNVWSVKNNDFISKYIKTDPKARNKTRQSEVVKIKSKNYYIHRLIAFHFITNPNMYEHVDHINGNSIDNRIENLRWIDNGSNRHNSRYNKGVTQRPNGRWVSQIQKDGKKMNLGTYDTCEEARDAYVKASKELFPNINSFLE